MPTMSQSQADTAIVVIIQCKLEEQGIALTKEQIQAVIDNLRWMQAKLKEQKG